MHALMLGRYLKLSEEESDACQITLSVNELGMADNIVGNLFTLPCVMTPRNNTFMCDWDLRLP
jgi:hypothetical protein